MVSELLERFTGCSPCEIWQFARREGYMIVTTDGDFYELATTAGPPPKVIWLRRWRYPTPDAEFVLRRDAVRITDFAQDHGHPGRRALIPDVQNAAHAGARFPYPRPR